MAIYGNEVKTTSVFNGYHQVMQQEKLNWKLWSQKLKDFVGLWKLWAFMLISGSELSCQKGFWACFVWFLF